MVTMAINNRRLCLAAYHTGDDIQCFLISVVPAVGLSYIAYAVMQIPFAYIVFRAVITNT